MFNQVGGINARKKRSIWRKNNMSERHAVNSSKDYCAVP
jgi:hypothetical protein